MKYQPAFRLRFLFGFSPKKPSCSLTVLHLFLWKFAGANLELGGRPFLLHVAGLAGGVVAFGTGQCIFHGHSGRLGSLLLLCRFVGKTCQQNQTQHHLQKMTGPTPGRVVKIPLASYVQLCSAGFFNFMAHGCSRTAVRFIPSRFTRCLCKRWANVSNPTNKSKWPTLFDVNALKKQHNTMTNYYRVGNGSFFFLFGQNLTKYHPAFF